ncbi:MAG: UDP-2,3-diacylglucosamine diphosphatase [Candidatus Krumholzibacteria bacterium]|nr:UDP-2,3-diacylglucosamine diphosphatase [Candidatus Krumholzibacteria bacterium]
MRETVFFVSDTHFKYEAATVEERTKHDRFLDFLARIEGASKLYLMGDIFDFWFEYRSVVPRFYHDILGALSSLKKSGTEVYIAGGNHDHWLGTYISKALGFNILPTFTTHEIQGLRIAMTHGDNLLPGDFAYKTLKSVIRSRPAIAVARTVHPDALFSFARHFSRASKGITEKKTERAARTLLSKAPDAFFLWDNDVFIMGHVHYPCLERFGERTFVILGDWERSCSYLRISEGQLSLEFYRPGENKLIENR